MKTINFLTVHFIPENSVGTTRVLSFVKEMSKYYNVNIICLGEKGVINKNEMIKYTKNITIYYINQKHYDGKKLLTRTFFEIIYSIKLIMKAKKLNCHATMVTIPFMFLIPIVGYLTPTIKILDIRDVQWEYLDANSYIKKYIKRILTFIMVTSIKKFNYITVSNQYELNILSERHSIDNVKILSNGIDEKYYNTLSTINFLPIHPFTITYAGTIGIAQELKTLLNAAIHLKHITFLIIGEGTDLESLKIYAKKEFLTNVIFTGKVERTHVIKYYMKSSVLYTQLTENFKSAMPSKLYEYSAIGLPIIFAGPNGQAKSFTENLENSIVVPPNDVQALVHAIIKCKSMSHVISHKNRNLIKQNYIRDIIAKKTLPILDSCIN